MADVAPVSIDLREHGPNRLVMHEEIPVRCDSHDGEEIAAVLSVDLVAAYACGSSKMDVTTRLAAAAQELAKDPAFWSTIEPLVKRAWEKAQGA